MKKRKCLEHKQLNDLVFVQYNLRLRHNQLMNIKPDTDLIVLDDIDPTSDWVVETQVPKFDHDVDLDMDIEMEDLMEVLVGCRSSVTISSCKCRSRDSKHGRH